MKITHPAIGAGRLAVVTGGANGIGLAVARRLAASAMRICILDRDEEQLALALDSLGPDAIGRVVDVSRADKVADLARELTAQYGPPSFLMNNAGAGGGGDALSNPEGWSMVLGINLFGVLNGVQAFGPAMVASGEPGIIVNTGSKQGFTSPPGDTAYNVSKAAVRALTEGLAHTLRQKDDCRVTAHLLVPGFTYSAMVAKWLPEKPAGASLPDEVAEQMFAGLGRGDFYLWCQDHETSRETDEKRLMWSVQDVVQNRPALSRWHPDWKAAFDLHMGKGGN